ncbi:MAG: UPF0280 family protein [Granulosicoccus sp.]
MMAYAEGTKACTGSLSAAQAWLLDDGARLHLHHGPIDLLISATGTAFEVKSAYRQGTLAFQSVLDDLVAQLPLLRTRLSCQGASEELFNGPVARSMFAASNPFASKAVTPMIAVAGAVADHVMQALLENRRLQRACVNNGGDIALYLSDTSSYRVGVCRSPDAGGFDDTITLTSADDVGGIATSGWQGRSHSLGVADAVTVLAKTAAMADAAATIIANAVDIPHSPRIKRVPACELNPDSDLGKRLVTTDVSCLSSVECSIALDAGRRVAQQLWADRLIASAYLTLQNKSLVVGQPTESESSLMSPRVKHKFQLSQEPVAITLKPDRKKSSQHQSVDFCHYEVST